MLCALAAVALLPLLPPQAYKAFQGKPILYEEAAQEGPIERLSARLAAGELELELDPRQGYLPALLGALAIPESSQVLVFTKTSFQGDLIAPETPRAVFFGDDVYIGTIPGAPVIEITSMDPRRGAVFYTLSNDAQREARIERRNDECLQCHATSHTDNWPGNLVRSVHPDADGHPIVRSGSTFVTHATPIEERWGGWYVSGTLGDGTHLGNALADPATDRISPDAPDAPGALGAPGAPGALDLSELIATERYLSPHSDLVALLVLEHQAEMHNLLARAGYEARVALHRQEESNRMFGSPEGTRSASTERILQKNAERVLAYMLFTDEAPLPGPVGGASSFAADFVKAGRRDDQGRSLRDLDLETRLFRHPCSYLIHSPTFDGLPPELLALLYSDLLEILTGEPGRDAHPGLSKADRRAILEIVTATKANLPDGWGRGD